MRKTRERLVLRGGERPVVRAELSLDGRRVVTTSEDVAIVWNAENGKSLLTIHGLQVVASTEFSPDGTQILMAISSGSGQDGSVRLMDAATGNEVAAFEVPRVRGARFSYDGKRIVTASFDRTTKVIDVASRTAVLILQHDSWVDSAEFSRDGYRILTASADRSRTNGVFRIWDAKTGATLLTYKGHSAHSARFSPDAKRFITAGFDRTARVWDAMTGGELLRLEGHSDQVYSAAFNSDGTRVVTASKDMSARIWDATKGSLLTILRGHRYWVMSAVFSPDGRHILTASPDRTARIWDTGGVSGVPMISPLGVAAVNRGLSFTSDGKRVVGESATDGLLAVWDSLSGAFQKMLDCFGCYPIDPLLKVDQGHVLALNFDREVRDLDTGKSLLQLQGEAEMIRMTMFSPDGSRILTAAFDGAGIKLYNSKSGAEMLRLDHRCLDVVQCNVLAVAFNSDGSQIITGASDKTARLWDAKNGRELRRFTAIDEVTSAALSPDDAQVLTASGSRAQLWDSQDGKLLKELTGHEHLVAKAIFNHRGDRVLTASYDGTVRVWDTATRAELFRLEGGEPMTSAAFSHHRQLHGCHHFAEPDRASLAHSVLNR